MTFNDAIQHTKDTKSGFIWRSNRSTTFCQIKNQAIKWQNPPRWEDYLADDWIYSVYDCRTKDESLPIVAEPAPKPRLSVGKFYKITPKSPWSKRVVSDYGSTNKVGKLGKESVMFVNRECGDPDRLSAIDFKWGCWLEFTEADFEEVNEPK